MAALTCCFLMAVHGARTVGARSRFSPARQGVRLLDDSQDKQPASGFFDMYSEEELAAVLRVHEIFVDEEEEAGDQAGSPDKPERSLHELVCDTIAEIDAQARDIDEP